MQKPREVNYLLGVTQQILREPELELVPSDSQLVYFLLLGKTTEAQRNTQPPPILCMYMHPHDTHMFLDTHTHTQQTLINWCTVVEDKSDDFIST